MKCQECSTKFLPSTRGKNQIFCSTKCRMRAYRRRAAENRSKSRNVTEYEAEIANLKGQIQRLKRDAKQTNTTLNITIEKAKGKSGYLARTSDGEWAPGASQKEAFGNLVLSHAVTRPVTVGRVQLHAPAKKERARSVPCPVCGKKVKLINDLDGGFIVPRHRHDLHRRKTCQASDWVVNADGTSR